MIVMVMYPVGPGQKFDEEYYLKTHMPLVREKFAPTKTEVLRGAGSPSGATTYQIIANLEFPSVEAFGEVVKQHGGVVMGDIPNFTDTQPIIQFNDIIG